MPTLLHPEYIRSIPIVGNRTAHWLEQRVAETLIDDPADDPPISVVIRTYNEAATLENLMQDLSSQQVAPTEIIVVDNESTDNTREVAQKYGATIVTIRKGEFTYARSMNMGMEAATHDVVFLAVGHTLLSSKLTLHAGARHFKSGSKVGCAFYYALPSNHASVMEKITGGMTSFTASQTKAIPKLGMGLAATGAMFSKSAWRALGTFDERYETGGEDTILARAMLANGYDVICDPAVAVHHSHGETVGQFMKTQMGYYRIANGHPQQLNKDTLAERQNRLKSQQ